MLSEFPVALPPSAFSTEPGITAIPSPDKTHGSSREVQTQPWDIGLVLGSWMGKLWPSTHELEQSRQGMDAWGSSEGVDHTWEYIAQTQTLPGSSELPLLALGFPVHPERCPEAEPRRRTAPAFKGDIGCLRVTPGV